MIVNAYLKKVDTLVHMRHSNKYATFCTHLFVFMLYYIYLYDTQLTTENTCVCARPLCIILQLYKYSGEQKKLNNNNTHNNDICNQSAIRKNTNHLLL
mmetsp:Transcript_24576/g.36428  ORF Transcript_24576/g.36428 Transcript_24576/m.36428 type:complete len:98 (+) Transcript_24576:48-341(+)